MSVEEMMKRLDENDERENIKTEEYDYVEFCVQLKNKLLKVEIGEKEKQIVERALGLFSAGESEVNNNVFLSEYRYFTDAA